MNRMRKSLAGRELSTRAKNVLVNVTAYRHEVTDWFALVDLYKSDPTELEELLWRVPGAGRVVVNEVMQAIKPYLKGLDTKGEVLWLEPAMVKSMRAVVLRMAEGKEPDLIDRNTLRTLHAALSARTIHTRMPGG